MRVIAVHNNDKNKMLVKSLLVLSCVVFGSRTVLAQQTPADSAQASVSSSAVIEEVIVSARRTQESQQDVPIAVTTMNSDVLQRESIGTLQDLQGRVPSLIMSTGGQQRNTEAPTLRGQGGTYGGGSGVAQYYAEVPLPADTTESNVGGPGKFFDIADIQILKGAQGTLFGKNTTGGALLLTPNKPNENFSIDVGVESGNYHLNGYEVVVNLPLLSETLMLRLGAKYQDRDGFTEDVANGTRYDDRHYKTYRFGLLWRPTDRLENYLLAYDTESRTNGTGTVIKAARPELLNALIIAQGGLSPLPILPAEAQPGCLAWDALLTMENSRCGQLYPEEQSQRDNRHVELSADPTDFTATGAVINTLTYEFTDSLSLRYIASYSYLEHQYRWDTDGSRAEWTEFVTSDDDRQTDITVHTEELQLQGLVLDGNMEFSTGLYYEIQKPDGPEGTQIRALYNDISVDWEIEKESYAAYAQSTYNLAHVAEGLDRWEITAGVRKTYDRVEGESVFVQSIFGVPSEPALLDGELKDSAITWTLGVDYKGDHSLLYAKVSRGYKVGGFTITAANPDNAQYESEYVFNYEIGNKLDFSVGEVPIRLNTAVYYTDYTDMQRHGVDVFVDSSNTSVAPRLGAAVFNAGEASIAGVEMEATIIPLPRLMLLIAYSYTDAQYDEYFLKNGSSLPVPSCTGEHVGQGEMVDLSCMPFLYTPEHQYSVTAIYDVVQSIDWGNVSASLTWAWTDENYTSATTLPETEPGAWLDPSGLLTASLSWDNMFNQDLSLQLFGTNLLDKEYIMSNQNVWNTLGYRTVTYGEPRMFGARLSYHWGSQ